jgi:hypothetical protein
MARRSISLLAAGLLLLGASTVSAQTPQESRPERPYRGLYAGGTDDAQQVLTVNGSLGTGYDTNAAANQTEAGLLVDQQAPFIRSNGSTFSSLSGGLSYSAGFSSASIGASLSSSARYYPDQAVTLTTSHAGSGGINFNLGRNTKVAGNLSASYQPFRSFLPFQAAFDPVLGQITPPDQSFGGGRHEYITYTTGASVTHQLSQRAQIAMSYDRYISGGTNGSGQELNRQGGSFLFTRSLTRRMGLRLGYGYDHATYVTDPQPFQNHRLDTGVDYSRDFSLTRRTKLGFSTGGAAIKQGTATRYDVTGRATLTREIGRTWGAALNYNRGVGFIEALRAPTFSDGLSAGLHGLISRRLSFSSSVAATVGTIGVSSASRSFGGFDAWSGTAGVSTALTRHLALGINYSYYRYSFDNTTLITNDLLSRVGRHSVAISLNAWAPVLKHGRKPDASR